MQAQSLQRLFFAVLLRVYFNTLFYLPQSYKLIDLHYEMPVTVNLVFCSKTSDIVRICESAIKSFLVTVWYNKHNELVIVDWKGKPCNDANVASVV
jgi:hypothetical protein